MDKTSVKKLRKLSYPWINFMKKIYIERNSPKISLEFILEEYTTGTINKISTQKNILNTFEFLKKKGFDQLFFKRKSSDNVKIRVISNTNLIPNPPQPISDILFIHIHGGGFVAMGSHSHQCHTRL